LPIFAFCAAAIAATWPLVLHPARTIAGGLGDPLLNTFILAWDADRARHLFRGLWDAPFLYPHRHTLAYSEHLLGIALFTTPIEWISRNPILTYNVAYISSYAFAGLGMFLLVRALVGRSDAALLAGLAFELSPYRLAQSTHLQVLMNGWMPIGLWALHEYFATGSRRWLAGFAAAFVLLGFSNGYYFYFCLIPVGVAVSFEMAGPHHRRLRTAIDLLLAAAVVVAVVAPVAWVYLRLQREGGFVRSDEELAGLSARIGDYFRVPHGGWTWGGLLIVGGGERELFHGFVVMAFAVVGVIAVRSRTVATYLVMTALAVWLSMGPGGGPLYVWLFHTVPGFNGLRVPARFSTVVLFGLAVLAGAGFAWMLARLPRRVGSLCRAAIAAVIVLEGQHGVVLSEVPAANVRSWDRVGYEWLRMQPGGAALELPISQQDDFHPYTLTYQLETLRHRHPIVNGYSGWRSMLQELLGGTMSPLRELASIGSTLEGLHAIGVRYVLLHEELFPSASDAASLGEAIRARRAHIAEEQKFGQTWIWRLQGSAPPSDSGNLERVDPRTLTIDASQQQGRLPLLVDGDRDTRWVSGDPQSGGEWLEVRLSRATDVARVQLATADRSLGDYPRHVKIESIDEAGHARVVFDDGIIDRLIEAMARDERYPIVDIDLPSNRTMRLKISQTAQARTWWALHELIVWQR
jgi:hypothetical protein